MMCSATSRAKHLVGNAPVSPCHRSVPLWRTTVAYSDSGSATLGVNQARRHRPHRLTHQKNQTVTFGANLLRFPKSGHPDGLSSRGQTLHVNRALIWYEVLCAADFRARIGARVPVGRVR